MPEAITHGVRIRVESRYLAHQSAPAKNRFVFAYTVTITNDSEDTVQLKQRHWVITDASEHVEEVRGDGVVGEQPVLEPQQSFQYTSGCVLKTSFGTMHGSYSMHRTDGAPFEAEIPPFLLAAPFATPGGLPS